MANQPFALSEERCHRWLCRGQEEVSADSLDDKGASRRFSLPLFGNKKAAPPDDRVLPTSCR